LALFLRREPQKRESFFADPDQLELFPEAKKRPRRVSAGAPLLVEPKEAK